MGEDRVGRVPPLEEALVGFWTSLDCSDSSWRSLWDSARREERPAPFAPLPALPFCQWLPAPTCD